MDKLICIYKITNTVTGDFYIGQMRDLDRRIRCHKNNPPYNTIKIHNWTHTPETCLKISLANMGREHTTESCEKMSEKRLGVTLSDEQKEKCRQKSLGNKSRSKAVVCVETGKVYDNMKIAAADIGIDPSAISGVIRGVNITAGGYHWRYADEDANTGSRKRNVAVICLDTGEYFPTCEAAAKKFGISATTVSRIANGKYRSSLHFILAEEPSYNEIRGENKRGNHRPEAVICVETNERFQSIRHAARTMGIANTSISGVLRGTLKTAGGFHWKYAD